LSQTAEAERDYAHAEALAAVASSSELDAKRLLVRAELYRKTSRFAEGAVAAKAALDELERRGRGDSLEAATAHLGMAIAGSVSGDAEAAAKHIARTVAIRSALLGARHPDVVEAYMNLAIIEARRGEFASARARAMQALETVGPTPSPDLALLLTNLAVFEANLGEREAAREHFARAADIDRMVLGDHPSTALALTNLAEVELAAGRSADAARHYDEAELRLRQSGATDARVTASIAYGRGQLAPEGSDLAVGELGKALELLDSKGIEPQLRAEVRFAFARALAKKSPARALAEATRALGEAKDLHTSTADLEAFVTDLRKKIAR
jgi:tetratricopeptide (TPR) repeat protein